MRSVQNVRFPAFFFGGARGGAFAGALGGGRIAGAPVFVAGRIAVWAAGGATFGVAATDGFAVEVVDGLGAVPVGEVAGGEVGGVGALVLGVPISVLRSGYSVMRLCSCSAFRRRSRNQALIGQAARQAPASPITAGIVSVVCWTQLVWATGPEAT